MSNPDEFEFRNPKRPMDAFDMHLSYFEWMGSAGHYWSSEIFCQSYNQSGTNGRVQTSSSSHMPPEDLMFLEAETIDRARTVYVDPMIVSFIIDQADVVGEPVLHAHDLLLPNGLVVFSRPIPYFDFSNLPPLAAHDPRLSGVSSIPLRAVAWKSQPIATTADGDTRVPGITVWCYASTDDAILEWEPAQGTKPPFTLMDLTAWAFDTPWTEEGTPTFSDAFEHSPHASQLRRMLYVLWKFGQNRLSRAHVDRPGRRRWERSGKEMPEFGDIAIHHLRAFEPGEYDPEKPPIEVEWSHRWDVREHWRKIKNKDGTFRYVHVKGHVKGPEWLPYVAKDRIYSVDR